MNETKKGQVGHSSGTTSNIDIGVLLSDQDGHDDKEEEEVRQHHSYNAKITHLLRQQKHKQ